MRQSLLSILMVLALAASGCGRQSEPIAVNVLRATTVADSHNRRVLVGIQVELENHGEKPVHLSHDSVQGITAGGERSSLRALRHALKQPDKDAFSSHRQALIKDLQRLGIDEQGLRDLAEDVIEVAPGTRLVRTFPFHFDKHPEEVLLELAYHDVATDKIFQVRQEVVLNTSPPSLPR